MKAQLIFTQFMLDHINDLEFQIVHMLHELRMPNLCIAILQEDNKLNSIKSKKTYENGSEWQKIIRFIKRYHNHTA